MFNEILRIKPVLDSGTAKKMEDGLTNRFHNVAKSFGRSLNQIVRGTIFGIGLGLLNRLLNPLEALETKIKGLLTQGEDLKEAADRFGTSTGELKQLQDVAGSLGLGKDALKGILETFAQKVELARKELANPLTPRSESTLILGPKLANQQNIVASFLEAMQGLQKIQSGKGSLQFFGETQQQLQSERLRKGISLTPEEEQKLIDQGLARRLTGKQSQSATEEALFGSQQFGAIKSLIEANFGKQAEKIGEKDPTKLTRSADKLANLEAIRHVQEIKDANIDFLQASGKLTQQMVKEIQARQARDNANETAQLDSFDNLAKMQEGVDLLHQDLEKAFTEISKIGKFILPISQFFNNKVLTSPSQLWDFVTKGKWPD